MYKKQAKKDNPQLRIESFFLPFGGKLSSDNQWVKLASIITWDEFEEKHAVVEGSDTTVTFTADSGYVIEDVTLNGTSKGTVSSLALTNIRANTTVEVTFAEQSGSICDGVQDWDPNQNWTEYSAGDKRVNGGSLWNCKNPTYSYYEPSSTYGYYGWEEVGSCK